MARKLTHDCQLIAMDFGNRLAAIDNFCAHAYGYFQPILNDLDRRREEARRLDYAPDEPPSEDEGYLLRHREEEVADQEYPVFQASEVVGCFALVHLSSSIELFIDDLLKDARLRRPAKKRKRVKARPDGSQKIISAIRVLEDAIGNHVAPDSVPFIKDMILARNDFVHHRGYRRTARRFYCEGDDRIVFGTADVQDALEKLRGLHDFFETECKAIGQEI